MPKTITKTYTLYTFDELSDKAKEKAREWYRSAGFEYLWSDEWRDSLGGFQKEFNFKADKWEVSTHRGYNYRLSGDMPEIKGVRLLKYLQNNHDLDKLLSGNCPFTGYCGDESALDPIRTFTKKPVKEQTYENLMRDCLDSFFSEWTKDMEYQESDEYIDDHMEANEYTFNENGERTN